MPAVTLQNSTTHRSQNCGVLMALAALTLAVVTSFFSRTVLGSQPSGFQSSAGTRTLKAPNIMKQTWTTAKVRNSSITACPSATDAGSVASYAES